MLNLKLFLCGDVLTGRGAIRYFLNRISQPFNAGYELADDGVLQLT